MTGLTVAGQRLPSTTSPRRFTNLRQAQRSTSEPSRIKYHSVPVIHFRPAGLTLAIFATPPCTESPAHLARSCPGLSLWSRRTVPGFW